MTRLKLVQTWREKVTANHVARDDVTATFSLLVRRSRVYVGRCLFSDLLMFLTFSSTFKFY